MRIFLPHRPRLLRPIVRVSQIECAMENYEAWFVRMQPTMTVPCMAYGESVIGDSKDILYFLSREHPDVGLYPEEHREAIDQFLDLFYSQFGVIAQFTFGHWVRKSTQVRDFIARGKVDTSIAKLKALIQEHPDLKDVGERTLAKKQRMDFVAFMMAADLPALDERMKGVLDTMEARLAHTAFVCGDAYTLADITATAFLARVHIVKQEGMFGPHVLKYWREAIKTRPSFQQAYVCSNWDETLMSRQIEAFANGLDPASIKWTGPPTVR